MKYLYFVTPQPCPGYLLVITRVDECQLAMHLILHLFLWLVAALVCARSTPHWWGLIDQGVPQETKTPPVFSVQRHSCIWKRCHSREKGIFWQLMCKFSLQINAYTHHFSIHYPLLSDVRSLSDFLVSFRYVQNLSYFPWHRPTTLSASSYLIHWLDL